jgi:hypothetical protein
MFSSTISVNSLRLRYNAQRIPDFHENNYVLSESHEIHERILCAKSQFSNVKASGKCSNHCSLNG